MTKHDDVGRHISLGMFSLLIAVYAATSTRASADASTDPPAAADLELQTIVVTAERREESLQKSSVAIQVLSGNELNSAGISQATDLQKLVPGLQIGTGGPAAQVYIRGVGDFGSTSATNPAVAFNIDGIYIARAQGISGNFFDIDRVEVLKGPQGTLYGRNATGGAINIITRKPDLDAIGGDVSLEVGNYGEVKTEAAINLPVSSEFAIRAATQDVRREGYASDGTDDDIHQSFRLSAFWRPSDAISLLVAGDYSHEGGKGAAYYLDAQDARAAGVSPWTSLRSPAGVATEFAHAGPLAALINPLSDYPPFQDNRFWSIYSELNWHLPFATLTLLPSYRAADMRYAAFPTIAFEDGQSGFGNDPDTSRATSVEIRLSNSTPLINWVGGLYYFKETQVPTSYTVIGLLDNSQDLSRLQTTNYAGFGQATFSVTDEFRVIAGARYTSDKRSLTDASVSSLFPSLGCLDPAVPSCLVETLSGSKTFTKVTWKGGVEYDLTAENMLYATVSTGFKAGGLSQAAAEPVGDEPLAYEPETLKAYEIGARNRFLDNRLQVNIEGFYWQYDDHQDSHALFDARNQISLATINTGNARIFGYSFDTVARLTSADTLRFAAEYLDSKYQTYSFQQAAQFVSPATTGCAITPTSSVGPGGPILNVNCAGFPLTHAPKWSGTAGYDHAIDLPNGGRIDGIVESRFATSSWLASDYIVGELAPGYATLDLSVVYSNPSRAWSVTGFVRNATEERVYTGGYAAEIPGLVTTNLAPPRTYGARFNYHF